MKTQSALPRLKQSLVALAVTIILNLFMAKFAAAAVVDIMIVYDTTATSWVALNGGMSLFSEDIVNKMNLALQNSEIDNDSFRLVHSMSVGYTTTSNGQTSLSPDLYPLQGGSDPFAAVHTARNTYGADLVAMMVDTGSAYGYVGVGYTLWLSEGTPDYGFTVNAIQSVNLSHTLTHEVGHNLGAHHAKNQAQSPGPNTNLDNQYSAGWYFTGTNSTKYHTIMAYNSDGYGNRYISAPLFSTPLKSYQGTTAGHAADGDNTRLIKETIATIAGYRSVAVTLTGLSISGPASVDENDTASYTATANWSNGSTTTETPSWTENSGYTTISSSGVLSANSVPSNQTVTVAASFASGGVTKTASRTVTVNDVPVTLTGLSISGPASVDENNTAPYTATANWSDSSTSTVTPIWSENSVYAIINSSGTLSAASVPSSQSVTITASYIFNGVTKDDTHQVTIIDSAVTLSSLTINGPVSVTENNTATYTATARWSDNSTSSVTPTWSENSSYSTINNSGVLRVSSLSSDQMVTIGASYTANGLTRTDTHSVSLVNVITLGEAVDNTTLSWSTSSGSSWFGQSAVKHGGSSSAKSGNIGNSEQSYIETTVRGPGTINFFWKVSSESNYDFFRFYIDGTESDQVTAISGEVDWQQKTVSIASGDHTLKWAYLKDSSDTDGSDSGWLDQVVWNGGTTTKFPWPVFLNAIINAKK